MISVSNVVNQALCYEQHNEAKTLWRGEAADILPHRATPLTCSIFAAAQPHVQRLLAGWLDISTAPLWRVEQDMLFLDPRAWARLAQSAQVQPGMVAHILGLPAADATTHPPHRRLFGLLPPTSPHHRWQRVYEETIQVVERIPRWARRVMRLRWEQAEILQVMEEIAVRAGEALAVLATSTLALADILYALPSATPDYVYQHVNVHTLPSLAPLNALDARTTPITREDLGVRWPWLSDAVFEVATPRWGERASPTPRVEAAGESTDPAQRGADLWAWVNAWLQLRETARVALAWVCTASRHWTLAVATEAQSDGRLHRREDVFLLELEELKQLMTGEWSDPTYVQNQVKAREATSHASTATPPPGGKNIQWRQAIASPETYAGIVGAPGWHPGDLPRGRDVTGVTALARGVFAFGRLLAAGWGVPFVDGETE